MKLTLADFLKVAPIIRVSRVEDGQTTLTKLKPTDRELQKKDAPIRPYSRHSLDGTGTSDDPYQPCASDESPYMAIVRIWLRLWNHAPFFIEINDCRLEVMTFGFKADNGNFTTLLPTR